MAIRDFKDLRVYQNGYDSAMRIFHLSRSWPKTERYALTDQIRRSSRSVCANISEAWAERRDGGHFVSKLSDAESEAAETMTWIDFAHDCGYISPADRSALNQQYDLIRGGLIKMMAAPEKWCTPGNRSSEPPFPYIAE